MKRCPGAVESHWVPTEPELWEVSQYEEFLKQRRIMLAKAANTLLNSLYDGSIQESSLLSFATRNYQEANSEEEDIAEMSEWMASVGLYEGTMNHELLDDDGNVAAIIDLAWPQGIQSGLSEPVALLLNETADMQAIVCKHGYRYYTSVPELKQYATATFLS